MNDIDIHLRSEKSCVRCSGLLTTQLKLACIAGGIFYHRIITHKYMYNDLRHEWAVTGMGTSS